MIWRRDYEKESRGAEEGRDANRDFAAEVIKVEKELNME